MPLYVIAYDISEDRRRARMAKLLEDLMPRVQRSVFEGSVPEARLRAVLPEAITLLEPGSDSLRVYTVCGACAGKVEAYGGPPPGEISTVRVI
jgi:CRISPR-associated protein Cas2